MAAACFNLCALFFETWAFRPPDDFLAWALHPQPLSHACVGALTYRREPCAAGRGVAGSADPPDPQAPGSSDPSSRPVRPHRVHPGERPGWALFSFPLARRTPEKTTNRRRCSERRDEHGKGHSLGQPRDAANKTGQHGCSDLTNWESSGLVSPSATRCIQYQLGSNATDPSSHSVRLSGVRIALRVASKIWPTPEATRAFGAMTRALQEIQVHIILKAPGGQPNRSKHPCH